MSLFLETIRIENGRIHNPDYHIRRMIRTSEIAGFSLPARAPVSFLESLKIPEAGLYRLRILYSSAIFNHEIISYRQKEIRSLKVVCVPRPGYSLKYADRYVIDRLSDLKGECDEVLIVSDDFITDTSYCNVALERKGFWYTPARPLLKGTMREFLLDSGILREEEIRLSGLGNYSMIRLFNAMIPWERAITLPLSAVKIP